MNADDWRADGYRWRQGGKNESKVGDGTLHKRYFQAYDGPKTWTKRFLQSEFSRQDCPNVVLLVYEGDETAAINFPHGNAKLARAVSRPYVRTQPHVLKDIQNQASTSTLVPPCVRGEGERHWMQSVPL